VAGGRSGLAAMIDGDVTVPTPRHGRLVTYLTRTDTNDGALVMGIIASDEYGLGYLPELHGVAIDVGAHIGIIAIALAFDHPDLRIIAVEPVTENVEVLRVNVAQLGLTDRVTIVEAAASAPGRKHEKMLWNYRSAKNTDDAYIIDSRYIANIFDAVDSESDSHTVRAVSLDTLMEGIDRLALLKVDCEGCEWQFLRSPRVADVDLILGEYHNAGGMETLRALIGATHEVDQTGGGDDIGTFRAVRR